MSRLFLADDNLTTQRVVELTFAGESIETFCFENGAAALEALQEQGCDVLLSNIALPDLDGYELCRRIRAMPGSENVPTILLVGAFQSFDQNAALQAGCRHHLVKPFETSQLSGLVHELLGISERPSEPRRKIPGLLFEIPLKSVVKPALFELDIAHCRPNSVLLERECVLAVPSHPRSSVEPEQFDDLVRKASQ